MNYKQLSSLADKARENAYAPYSSFTVGAALLCSDGSVYTGCNIESSSYTPTCCAERVAIFSAIADGKRELSAIAVAGGQRGTPSIEKCYPCGVCRQVMSEFCSKDFPVIFFDGTTATLEELLPHAFELKNM